MNQPQALFKFQVRRASLHRYVFAFLCLAALPLQAQDVQPAAAQLPGTLRNSGLPEGQKSVTLPLESNIYGFLVDAQINGKPVKLFLDTGASKTNLTPEAATRVGIDVTNGDDADIATATEKTVKIKRAVTHRIDLGGAWTKNEEVWISTLPPGTADGLLGMNTLADWDVRIDPKAKSLTLFSSGKADALKGESVVPLTSMGSHRFSVPVRVGGQHVDVMVDTGFSKTLQLPSVFANKVVPGAMKKGIPSLDAGMALSGKIVSRSIKIPEFTFGPVTLEGLPAYVGEPDKTPCVIGLGVLRHYVLTFRFSARELRLKPLGTVQDLTRGSTAGLNLLYGDAGRIIIQSVDPRGPAAKAGLRAGDELLEIEGNPLKTMKPEQLAAFTQLPPGTALSIRYRRGNAEPLSLKLVLAKK